MFNILFNKNLHIIHWTLCVAAFRNLGQNLWGPHRYGCLNDIVVSGVVAGPCAAHSLLITTEGKLWSWGEYHYKINARNVLANLYTSLFQF